MLFVYLCVPHLCSVPLNSITVIVSGELVSCKTKTGKEQYFLDLMSSRLSMRKSEFDLLCTELSTNRKCKTMCVYEIKCRCPCKELPMQAITFKLIAEFMALKECQVTWNIQIIYILHCKCTKF